MKKLLVILVLLSFATACQGFGGTWAFGPWTSGESLVDPGEDQTPFWDDSLGRMEWAAMATTRWVVPPPDTSTSVGTIGDLAGDVDFLYYCFGTNLWRRIAGSEFGLDTMIYENGDTMIYENGDTMVYE